MAQPAPPYTVSPDLLARDDFRAACEALDFGAIFRLMRKYDGASQDRVSSPVPGLTQSRVSRVMSGETRITSLDLVQRIADALRIPGAYFRLAPRPWEAEITPAEAMPPPALAGIGAVDLSHVTPGLPADMEPIAAEIENLRVLFAAGSDALDQPALSTIATAAGKLRRIATAADANRYDLTMRIVGRADPTGAETDNLALSRRRATAVRDRLLSLGAKASRVAVEATGSGDPIPADTPAERARVNRSVSFTIRAQPSLTGNVAQRQR